MCLWCYDDQYTDIIIFIIIHWGLGLKSTGSIITVSDIIAINDGVIPND